MATSPTSGPGSAAAVTTHEGLSGNAVSIANGATGSLTWNTSFAGTALLNRTVPALPTVIAAGTYAVAVAVVPTLVLAAGGWYEVALELDVDNDDMTVRADSPVADASLTNPKVSLAAVWTLPAAGKLALTVGNHDGTGAVTFALQTAIVQRLA